MRTEIRNNPGQSGYFLGRYQGYGRYQWNIKYYGWENNDEIEQAQLWAFGDYLYTKGEFEFLNEIVGRPIKASIQGRSGGWLVVDTELTKEELEAIDEHVAGCMDGLKDFLKEERDHKEQMELDAKHEAEQAERDLKSDSRVQKALELIEEVAGCDAVLVIKGIKLK